MFCTVYRTPRWNRIPPLLVNLPNKRRIFSFDSADRRCETSFDSADRRCETQLFHQKFKN